MSPDRSQALDTGKKDPGAMVRPGSGEGSGRKRLHSFYVPCRGSLWAAHRVGAKVCASPVSEDATGCELGSAIWKGEVRRPRPLI